PRAGAAAPCLAPFRPRHPRLAGAVSDQPTGQAGGERRVRARHPALLVAHAMALAARNDCGRAHLRHMDLDAAGIGSVARRSPASVRHAPPMTDRRARVALMTMGAVLLRSGSAPPLRRYS